MPDVFAQGFNGTGSTQLDSWIAIGADGLVTAYTGKCDFGQGLYTAQMQLVAEELSVPFDRVRLIQCDTSMTPDQGTTSGQQSHPTNFNRANLALAVGHGARDARPSGVGASRRRASGSRGRRTARVSVKTAPSQHRHLRHLVGGRKFEVALDPDGGAQTPA